MQMQANTTTSQDVGQNRSGSRSPGPGGSSNSANFYGSSFSTAFQDASGANGSMNGTGAPTDYLSPDSGLGGAQASYSTATQYTYPEPSVTSAMSYPTDTNVFANPAYPAPDGSLPTNALNNRGASTQPTNATAFNLFAQTTNASTAYHPSAATWSPNPGSQSWRQWTGTMAGGNLDTQESYSVSALMQLGGRDLTTAADAGTGGHAPVADMGAGTTTSVRGSIGSADVARQQPWPLTIFDSGQGGGTRQRA